MSRDIKGPYSRNPPGKKPSPEPRLTDHTHRKTLRGLSCHRNSGIAQAWGTNTPGHG